MTTQIKVSGNYHEFEFPFNEGDIISYKGQEAEIINAVAIWNGLTNRYPTWFAVFLTKDIARHYAGRIMDYIRFCDESSHYPRKWLAPYTGNQKLEKTSLFTFSNALQAIVLKEDAELIKMSNEYTNYPPERRAVMRTINRLWRRQDYYKSYIKGSNNEM